MKLPALDVYNGGQKAQNYPNFSHFVYCPEKCINEYEFSIQQITTIKYKKVISTNRTLETALPLFSIRSALFYPTSFIENPTFNILLEN